MDEKLCETEVDESCCEGPCAYDSRKPRLTKEEKLKNYEEYLQNDLKNQLEDIEISEAKRELFKKFKKDHESEYQKIENYKKSRRLTVQSTIEAETEAEDDKVKIPQEEIDRMTNKYLELGNRQAEILRIATTKEELKKVPIDQMNAMVDEYMASEKLKLILVDRLRAILDNRRVHLACDNFSNSILKFANES